MALISDIKSKIVFKSLINEYNKTRLIKQTSSFCYAPAIALRFSLNGNVFSCCFNRMFSLGKYPDNSLSEIWFGKRRQDLQKSVKKLNLNEIGCHSCYSSLRSRSFNLVGARNYDLNEACESVKYPQIIDFELDNLCNLQCVMCNGENSSSIRTQIECEENYEMCYDDLFVEQLNEFIPHLIEARFSGGEPFLSNIYYDIWNRIIQLNPSCKIYIQSNGTIFNEKIINLFQKGNVNVSFSIDSIVKSTYSEIRRGSNFEVVMMNFKAFQDISIAYNREIGVSLCVMNVNILEFIEYMEFFNQYNVKLTLHKVIFPIQYSIAIMPLVKLEEILSKFSLYKPVLKSEVEKVNYSVFTSVIAFVKSLIDIKKEVREKEDSKSDLNLTDLIWNRIENKMFAINQQDQGNVIKANFNGLIEKISTTKLNDEYLVLLSKVPVSILLPELITNNSERLFSRIFIHLNQNNA